MKFVTFSSNGERAGQATAGVIVDEQHIVSLAAAYELSSGKTSPHLESIQSVIEGGETALNLCSTIAANPPSEHVLKESDVRLLAPLPVPAQIRDFLCFEEHLRRGFESAVELRSSLDPNPEEKRQELLASGKFSIPEVWYKQPIYYKSNRFAVSGPEDDIYWPSYSKIMDYELEIAAVIGRKGRDISKDEAHEHIFGYTIFNDFSARDAQTIEMEGMLGPAKGKDFDGANSLGPCIVTRDEFTNIYDLSMVARVNGDEWSRGSTSTMNWKFEDIIAHLSRSETLHPGEILGSGTVGGGCGAEQGRFLTDGDVVELEIENIGSLRNKVRRSPTQ